MIRRSFVAMLALLAAAPAVFAQDAEPRRLTDDELALIREINARNSAVKTMVGRFLQIDTQGQRIEGLGDDGTFDAATGDGAGHLARAGDGKLAARLAGGGTPGLDHGGEGGTFPSAVPGKGGFGDQVVGSAGHGWSMRPGRRLCHRNERAAGGARGATLVGGAGQPRSAVRSKGVITRTSTRRLAASLSCVSISSSDSP